MDSDDSIWDSRVIRNQCVQCVVYRLTFFGKTDTGLRRSQNEDAFVVKPELGLCVVADGMGGAAAGEFASRIFVETALEVVGEAKAQVEQELRGLVQRAFSLAHERMQDCVRRCLYP